VPMKTDKIKLKGDPYRDEGTLDYPPGFRDALRTAYERSFGECDVPGDLQRATLDQLDLWESGDDWAIMDDHTVLMWHAGRLDLTIESLELSYDWRDRFPPRIVRRAERRLAALAHMTEQQRAIDSGREAGRLSPILDEAGCKTYVIDGRAYMVADGLLSRHFSPYSVGAWGAETTKEIVCCAGPGSPSSFEADMGWLPIHGVRHLSHSLTCQSCISEYPLAFELGRLTAHDSFLRTKTMLRNLAVCLDLGDARIQQLSAPVTDGDEARRTMIGPTGVKLFLDPPGPEYAKYALIWRAFFVAAYLPYVARVFVDCIDRHKDENPWIKLRAGGSLPEGLGFIPSLTAEEFEAALLAHEVEASCGLMRFRFAPPGELPSVPSAGEDLRAVPGFLSLREEATVADWSDFMAETLPEDMPSWGFDVVEGVIKLAAKAASSELARSPAAEEGVRSTLERIESQTDAIYGAQLPIIELQSDTRRAVGEVAQAQAAQAGLLQQMLHNLNRPSVRDAERSLRRILGDRIFDGLTEEAKAAAVEGEYRYLMVEHVPGECADPSTIPFQFQKAFECQLGSILEQFSERGRYRFSAAEISRLLEYSDARLLGFLKQRGIDHRLLHNKHEKLFGPKGERNLAAHRAVITEQRARELRNEYLGLGNGESIFGAVVPVQVEPRHDPTRTVGHERPSKPVGGRD